MLHKFDLYQEKIVIDDNREIDRPHTKTIYNKTCFKKVCYQILNIQCIVNICQMLEYLAHVSKYAYNYKNNV